MAASSHSTVSAQAADNINMILLGTTGNGRSSTIRAMMKSNMSNMSVKGGWDSCTQTIQVEQISFDDRTLTVVDTPGIHSSQHEDPTEATKKLIDEVTNSEIFHDGFDAIVLVFSYGKRFSQDEIDSIKILNKLLARDWLRSHGVILLTRGDSFKNDLGDELTLMDWCKQQDGMVGNLFQTCDYRCVLFDNSSDDKTVLDEQFRHLISYVDSIKTYNENARLRLPHVKEHLEREGIKIGDILSLMSGMFSRIGRAIVGQFSRKQ